MSPIASPPTRRPRRWIRLSVFGVTGIVVAAVAIPYAYIHFVEGTAPSKLALRPGTVTGGGNHNLATVTGAWSVTTGSVVGYRVSEKLLGQNTTAVGRTAAVTGTLRIAGTSLDAASFTARMATVKSDQSNRDGQFRGRIMDTATYPTATFTLTKPVALSPVPATGVVRSFPATGDLLLRGQTRPVTFSLSAERTASGLEVQGSIPIAFATWKVPNPSFGSFVTTADHGTLEFLLHLAKGAAAAASPSTS